MNQRKIFMLSAVLCVLAAGICFGDEFSSKELVSGELIKEAGLEDVWQMKLPIQRGEKLGRMFVFDKYLFVLTDKNYLFGIERVDGSVRFELPVAKAGLWVSEPQYFEEKLMFMVGNHYVVVDPKGGVVSGEEPLTMVGRSVVGNAARNSRHLFVAGAKRRLYAIVIDEWWEEFSVTADNDSLINSVVVDEKFVIFTTIAGDVVRISSKGRDRIWQKDVVGKISAPVVRDQGWVYVSSENTKVVKYSIVNGAEGWKEPFHSGIGLTEPVVVGREVIYQPAGKKGFYAINKRSGKKVWQVPGGVGLIAERGGRGYVYAEPGILYVMDNRRGKRLYSVNFAEVLRYAVNTTDPGMYVADERGRVASIAIGD